MIIWSTYLCSMKVHDVSVPFQWAWSTYLCSMKVHVSVPFQWACRGGAGQEWDWTESHKTSSANSSWSFWVSPSPPDLWPFNIVQSSTSIVCSYNIIDLCQMLVSILPWSSTITMPSFVILHTQVTIVDCKVITPYTGNILFTHTQQYVTFLEMSTTYRIWTNCQLSLISSIYTFLW